jgi:hypothetical protein
MEGLRFTPSARAVDPDQPVLSDDELRRAQEEGDRSSPVSGR